jgi:hypothetical protein
MQSVWDTRLLTALPQLQINQRPAESKSSSRVRASNSSSVISLAVFVEASWACGCLAPAADRLKAHG